MTELLIEQLVKKKPTVKDKLIKVGLIALTAVSFIPAVLFPYVIWLTMILVILDYILIKKLDVEYEYIYFNGDLDIDKIMSKEMRKRMFSTTIKEMEILAPTGSDAAMRVQHIKAIDLSTCNPENKTYEMVTMFKGEKVRLIFEPNEQMLNAIRDMAPRKVIF